MNITKIVVEKFPWYLIVLLNLPLVWYHIRWTKERGTYGVVYIKLFNKKFELFETSYK